MCLQGVMLAGTIHVCIFLKRKKKVRKNIGKNRNSGSAERKLVTAGSKTLRPSGVQTFGGPKIKQRTAESRGLAAIRSKIGVDSVPSGQKGAPFFDRVAPSPRDSAVQETDFGPST